MGGGPGGGGLRPSPPAPYDQAYGLLSGWKPDPLKIRFGWKPGSLKIRFGWKPGSLEIWSGWKPDPLLMRPARRAGSPVVGGSAVTEAGVDGSGGFDEGVCWLDESLFVGCGGDFDIGEVAVLHDDESVSFSEVEEFHGVVAEEGCEDSVAGDWCSSALDMAEDDIAGLDIGFVFDFIGEPFSNAAEADGVRACGVDSFDDLFAASGFGSFGGADDGESFSSLGSLDAGFGEDIEVEGDFGYEDDI